MTINYLAGLGHRKPFMFVKQQSFVKRYDEITYLDILVTFVELCLFVVHICCFRFQSTFVTGGTSFRRCLL